MAEAARSRIVEQYAAAAGTFLLDHAATLDFEAAKRPGGNAPLLEVAKFWRAHHPEKPDALLRRTQDSADRDRRR